MSLTFSPQVLPFVLQHMARHLPSLVPLSRHRHHVCVNARPSKKPCLYYWLTMATKTVGVILKTERATAGRTWSPPAVRTTWTQMQSRTAKYPDLILFRLNGRKWQILCQTCTNFKVGVAQQKTGHAQTSRGRVILPCLPRQCGALLHCRDH